MGKPTSTTADTPEQHFTVPCDCDRKGTVKLGHYDICRCPNCGCQFWALQPHRGGPLVLVPWPGLPKRERAAA